MLTVCMYLGTIKGEKLNEPKPDLSQICKNKKRPEWTQRVGPRWVPPGLQGSSVNLRLSLQAIRLGYFKNCDFTPSLQRNITLRVSSLSKRFY